MATLDGRRRQLEDRLAELGDRLRRIEAERSDLTAPSPTGFAEEPANEQVLADLAETALRESG